MPGPVLLLVAASAVILLALVATGRCRARRRSAGGRSRSARAGAASFGAVHVGRSGSRRPVVCRYGEGAFAVHTVGLDSRPVWRARRHDLEVRRSGSVRPAGQVLLHVVDGAGEEPSPLALEMPEACAGAVRAWAEAGPSQAVQAWWRAPGQA